MKSARQHNPQYAANVHKGLGSSADKLLRLARRRCDDTSAALAAVRVSRTSTETALVQLDHKMLTEQRRVEQSDNPAAHEDLARFMEEVRIKRANMTATLGQLDERETALNDDLSEALTEMRKFERLIELAERRDRKASDRRETKLVDDLTASRLIR